jgi:hypothetical protein
MGLSILSSLNTSVYVTFTFRMQNIEEFTFIVKIMMDNPYYHLRILEHELSTNYSNAFHKLYKLILYSQTIIGLGLFFLKTL